MAAKKQPGILAALTRDDQPQQPEPAVAPAPAPKAASRATKASANDQTHRTMVYIPRKVHNRLREIAFVERCSVNDLLMEGLDAVLASRGHAERTGVKSIS